MCGNPRHDQVLLKRSRTRLEADGIDNGVARRHPKAMAETMKELEFRKLQRKRAQTERRIAIFKHVYLGVPRESRGIWRACSGS